MSDPTCTHPATRDTEDASIHAVTRVCRDCGEVLAWETYEARENRFARIRRQREVRP